MTVKEMDGGISPIPENSDYRKLFEAAMDAIFLADPGSGTILDANRAASRLLARPREDIVGMHFTDLHPARIREDVKGLFAEDAGRAPEDIESFHDSLVVRSDGVDVPVEIVGRMVDLGGRRLLQGIFRDITRRKETEGMLEMERDRAQRYLDIAGVIIVGLDRQGGIREINSKGCAMLGVEREEILGRSWFEEFIPEDTRDEVEGVFGELMTGRSEHSEHFVNEVVTADGDVRTISWHNSVVTDEEGNVKGTLSSGLDLTDTARAQSALIESEERYRSLFESSPEGIAIIDTEGVIMDFNGVQSNIMDLPREDVIGRTFFELGIFPEDQLEMLMDMFERLLAGEEVDPFELRIERDDAQLDLEVLPGLLHRDGELVAIQVITKDVSERKMAERQLHESEDMFRMAFEHATIGRVMATPEGKLVNVNNVACDLVGYTKAELLGMSWMELTHQDHLQETLDLVSRLLQGRIPSFTIEEKLVRKDGNIVWVSLNVVLARDRDGDPLYLIGDLENITAAKLAEEERLESEARYRSLFEQSRDAIYITSRDGGMIDANPASYALFGYTEEDFEDFDVTTLYVDPEDRIRFQREIEQQGFVRDFETRFTRKDGSIMDCIITSSVRRDSDGIVIGYQGIIHDITELKRSAKSLEDSLREKEVLLKEIHHRVKNNMQVISSMLSLQATYIEDEDMLRTFDESQNRVKSMGLIHNKLYQSEDLSGVDLKEYTRTLGGQLIHSFGADGSGAEIRVRGDGIMLGIDRAVPVGLILNELISNSLKHAFQDGREGTISVAFVAGTDGGVRIAYSDDGVGFPEDIDFRDTQSLGMELVTTLVEQIEGTIELERGEGTRFVIEFTE